MFISQSDKMWQPELVEISRKHATRRGLWSWSHAWLSWTILCVHGVCSHTAIPIGINKLGDYGNRPFAAGGHMVQIPKYWRAKECARLQKKTQWLTRNAWFFFVYISQWSLVTFFCSPIFWILYHVTSSCKGPIQAIWLVCYLWLMDISICQTSK